MGRSNQDERDHLELLTDEEIRDLERQEKKDHDMIVNQAFRSGFEGEHEHEFVPRIGSGSKVKHVYFPPIHYFLY